MDEKELEVAATEVEATPAETVEPQPEVAAE